ncbi:hypothetical protein P7C73_g1070, partial [Tremellales sp. Uapishka_1]
MGECKQSRASQLITQYTDIVVPTITTTVSAVPVPTAELVPPPKEFNPSPKKACFPDDFIWGVASSAPQIEGAVRDEGRAPSYMDYYAHFPPNEVFDANGNKSTGDIAALDYYFYKEDIARIAALGVPYYSFSISWSRILPFGVEGSPINQAAVDHYDDVINTCLQYGVKPIVTMEHFDIPMVFIADPTAVPTYGYFLKILFTHYADRVPIWLTINEPNDAAGSWQGIKNILLAHAKASKLYHGEFQGTGQIAMKNSFKYGSPYNASDSEDVAAAGRWNDYYLGLTSAALFANTSYPKSMTDSVSALPKISAEELALIYGSADFNSVNIYFGNYIKASSNGIAKCASNTSDPLWPVCGSRSAVGIDGWEYGGGAGGAGGGANTPALIREALNYVHNTYPSEGGIFLGESGMGEVSAASMYDAQYDVDRARYYEDYTLATYLAMTYDHVKVIGLLAWSIVDQWEFGSEPYGLQYINPTTLARSYKKSFFTLVDIFQKQ